MGCGLRRAGNWLRWAVQTLWQSAVRVRPPARVLRIAQRILAPTIGMLLYTLSGRRRARPRRPRRRLNHIKLLAAGGREEQARQDVLALDNSDKRTVVAPDEHRVKL
jgi:hypothetical protein